MIAPGILTEILQKFESAFAGGFGRLEPSSLHLLYTVMGIDIVFFGLFAIAAEGGQIIVKSMRKILMYGVFVLLVTQWPELVQMAVNGFLWAGSTAGGGGGPSVKDPSAIAAYGFVVSNPMVSSMSAMETGTLGTLQHLGQIFMYEIAILVTMCAFFAMAIQCFIAYLEFLIVAVLSLVLLPFGPWKHTKFLSEKSIGAVISHGIKLMTLTFIIAIAGTVFGELVPAQNPTIIQAFEAAVAAMAIAMLCLHAPNLASGLMSGSPSLGAGAMLSGAAGAAMGGAAAMGAGRMLGAAGGSLATGGAGAVARAAGAVTQGGIAGMAAKAATAGLAFKAATGAAGAGQSAIAGLARKATQPAQKVGEFLKSNFQQGQLAENARRTAKGTPTAAGASSTSAAQTSPSATQAGSAGTAATPSGDSSSGSSLAPEPNQPADSSAAGSAGGSPEPTSSTGSTSSTAGAAQGPSSAGGGSAGASGTRTSAPAAGSSNSPKATAGAGVPQAPSSGGGKASPSTDPGVASSPAGAPHASPGAGGSASPSTASSSPRASGSGSARGAGLQSPDAQKPAKPPAQAPDKTGQYAKSAIDHVKQGESGGGGISMTLHSDE